jgi:hypothetical protein
VSLLGGITLLGAVLYPVLAASSPVVLERNDEGRLQASDGFDPGSTSMAFGRLPWRQDAGFWTSEAGVAALVTGNSQGGPSYATVETGSRSLRMSAKVVGSAAGWGLVFRYANYFNYSYLVLSPDFAAINIGSVDRIEDTLLKVISPAPMTVGQEVEVLLVGDTVTISIDGTPIGTAELPPSERGTSVGLMGLVSSVGVSGWDDFRVESLDR